MALKVKSISSAADKLVRNAQAASQEWLENTKAAGEAWVTGTQGAKLNYGQAVRSGGIEDRFARGVAKAGAAKFVRKVSDVGGQRFAPGVSAGKVDYQANAEGYFSLLAGLSLPPRAPRGSASNTQRVVAVDQALNAKRLALLGVSAGG
mgnify:CR=1 FL=1